MRIARATVVVLALIEGLWMGFDGTRALTVGDYLTRHSGPRAGELGAWHYSVESVGIAPRSVLMKIIFVAFGLAWLIVAAALLRRVPWAVNAALIGAVLTLWYLPVGTAFGVIEIALCLLLRRATLAEAPTAV
jgi:hypothetical protein